LKSIQTPRSVEKQLLILNKNWEVIKANMMLDRNFKLILLELQIILEKAKNRKFSEKDREEVRDWIEMIDEALTRVEEVYEIEKEKPNIFSNQLKNQNEDILELKPNILNMEEK